MLKICKRIVTLIFLLTVLILSFHDTAITAEQSTDTVYPEAAQPRELDIPKYFVPPPPFTEGIFPCSECHAEMEVNAERRELGMHEEQQALKHAGPQQWCLDCHNPSDRDKLRLISGQLVSFEESYLLCGQCHGTIFRDWKAGVHGKRTGEWNGKRLYRLCVHCHNPHQPAFKPLKPKQPPLRPADIR